MVVVSVTVTIMNQANTEMIPVSKEFNLFRPVSHVKVSLKYVGMHACVYVFICYE